MKKFVVISHTHWDREWYMSFECFRLRLVDLIDRLIGIINNDDEYIFHLDAQTIVLEDYLELRPQNKEILKNFIKSGNLVVGPWYLQNDFYLTSGESTIRNLQIGTAIAREYGKCSNVGYAPDQFGNVSQLPQILSGFGIDNFIFGRGFSMFETVDGERRPKRLPTEFVWVGADGTEALAIHLKHWYNNAQHIPEDTELAELLLNINESCFEGLNVSPYVLLMNGVDHLEAQADVRDVILRLQQKGHDIEQKSLDSFIADVKKEVEGKEIYKHKGALNYGDDGSVLKGCWSSRVYLKKANVQAEDLLINKIEPLYTYMQANGFNDIYPNGELNFLWKNLVKNHTHDCICGCSIDAVHSHMEDNFAKIMELGNAVLERGMKILALHSNHPMKNDQNYSITVFNGTERERSAVVEATINFTEKVDDFALYSENGKQIAYEKVGNFNRQKDVFSPLNLPGILDVNAHVIRFVAENVKPYSSAIYAVVPSEKGEHIEEKPRKSLENSKYRIFVEGDELHVLDKTTQEEYVSPILLEDCVDRGDAYVYRKSLDAPMMVKPTSFFFKEGALVKTLEFAFEYQAPEYYNFEKLCPSNEQVMVKVACALSIDKVSDVITLEYKMLNNRKDHRLRLFVNSGIQNGVIATDSVFDYDTRLPFESCDITDSNTHCMSSLASVFAGNRALSLFAEGQFEVALEGDSLAVTVLRSTGVINREPGTFKAIGGDIWKVDENQCLREISGRVGFSYGCKKDAPTLFAEAKAFRNGLLVHGDSFDYKKYSGGRFAVQSARLEKLYYVPDKFENCVASGESLFELSTKKLSITCVKRGICGGTIIRILNLTEEKVSDKILANGNIYLTNLAEDKNQYLGKGEALIEVNPKQMVTLRIENEKA